MEQPDYPRIVVLGTGAVGGLYGGRLAQAGYDVTFLARSDADHLRTKGLRVESPQGDFVLANPQVASDVSQLPPADLVIVSWKATANEALAPALQSTCTPTTSVLVLQNGWDVERQAAAVVGAERVLGGCCFLCSNKIGPGHIRHLDYGTITIGEYAPTLAGQITPRLQQIVDWLRRAGIDARAVPDLRVARWKKLMWNIPFNGLSVILQADTRALMTDADTRALVEQIMREVLQLARACGSEVEESHIDKLLRDTAEMVPYASSMLLDYQNRRPMEVEAIFGNPMRAGQAVGFSPPRIATLYHQLKFLDRRQRSAVVPG
ncbi:MAG: putative 2-dehydropantoate 2-reductase [Planctomycetota bacterium]|nr:MAG: putative 2-dehydropantoate 2-reductase [Planctomycetota bacterium]